MTETIRAANTGINTDKNTLNDEIEKCAEENGHVNLLKEVKHDHYWILKNDNHCLRTRKSQIDKHSPETKSIKIPLTICSLIQYADVIGASDDCLLQMILIFL